MKERALVFCIVLFLLAGCEREPSNKVIILQPLGAFSQTESQHVLEKIRESYRNVVLRKNISFPAQAYYSPRQRYRADSLIRFLGNTIGTDSVVVGLSSNDISTRKNEHVDWGVMGLAFRPGNACVVSTFRLKTNTAEQLYKVVVHELGHTQGLDHCQIKPCFMRDAEGKNPLDEEVEFCTACRRHLIERGWTLDE